MKNDFGGLVQQVNTIHHYTGTSAKSAVNQMLTVRNWCIGYYIVEYEQHGEDRAEYGANLLGQLADSLQIKGLDRQMLNFCRIFYQKYPQICTTVTHKLQAAGSGSPTLMKSDAPIFATVNGTDE